MLRTAICPNELLLASYLSVASRFASSSSAQARRKAGSSTSHAPAQEAPRVPRYIRRQPLAEAYAARRPPGNQNQTPEASSSRKISNIRQPNGDEGQPNRLLEPHVLSQRLKKLCDAGKINEAVSMLKSMPLDAQNPPVWNTLIWECMKASRYQLAYLLYTDMKRRGFSPTTRTYQTMFSGLSRIEHWSTYPKQLANAHALYDYFTRHISSVKKHDPDSDELSTRPLSYYIKILGETGNYQTIFDVYYALPSEGRMAPDQYIYTAMFNALAGKRTVESTSADITFDAKHLWAQAVKASKQSPGFAIDAHLVAVAINALARGRPADQTQAFTLAREYFGLSKPGGDAIQTNTLALTAPALAASLSLCNLAAQPRLCLYFLRQVRSRPQRLGGREVIDKGHIEEVLKAHIALAVDGSAGEGLDALRTVEWMINEAVLTRVPSIRPTASTYRLLLAACWRSGDWESALRALELMTGMNVRAFADGAPAKVEVPAGHRPAWRHMKLDTESMGYILRTAYATKNRAHMRQALRLADHIGVETLFGKPVVESKAELPSNKDLKNIAFLQMKLAEVVIQTVQYVESQGTSKVNDTQRWRGLHDRAHQILQASPKEKDEQEALIQTETVMSPGRSSGVRPLKPARSTGGQHVQFA